jgi:hypothetical protein
MSCIAMADHIQDLDMPSSRSVHAASVRDTGFGRSKLILTLQRLVMSPTLVAFAARLQVFLRSKLQPISDMAWLGRDIGNGRPIQFPIACGGFPSADLSDNSFPETVFT